VDAISTNSSGVSGNISTSVEQGVIKAVVNINTDAIQKEIAEATQKNPLQVNVLISSEYILEQMKKDGNSGLNIAVIVPDELRQDNVSSNITVDADILKAAKNAKRNITVTAENNDGHILYSWTFTADNLSRSKKDISDLNISLAVNKADKKTEPGKILNTDKKADSGAAGLLIDFSQSNVLPAQAQVSIYVKGYIDGIKENSKVYLYYYNEKTKKLEVLPYSSGYKVDTDGYVTIKLVHCSQYVLLPEKAAKNVQTSLDNQVKVNIVKKTLYVNKKQPSKFALKVTLPSTLEMVSSFAEETSGSAIGAVTVTYKSSNNKVCVVDSKGVVQAKGIGKATITTKITLYYGKTKTFKTQVVVKKP